MSSPSYTVRASSGPITLPLSPYPSCPSCQHAQFVVSQMVLPQTSAQAAALGCDINGDGEIDNQMGKVISAARTACQDFGYTGGYQRGIPERKPHHAV